MGLNFLQVEAQLCQILHTFKSWFGFAKHHILILDKKVIFLLETSISPKVYVKIMQ